MQTERFNLRPIVQEDIHFVHKGLSDPEITAYYGVHFDTLEETQGQMDWYAALVADGKGKWWAVVDKANGDTVGAGGYNDRDTTHKKAEIGFWLLKEYWGQGIMKEVMPALFQLGFDELELNRIEGFVVGGNDKCKRALAKTKFVHEGTLRQSEMHRGEIVDVDVFALLKSDFD